MGPDVVRSLLCIWEQTIQPLAHCPRMKKRREAVGEILPELLTLSGWNNVCNLPLLGARSRPCSRYGNVIGLLCLVAARIAQRVPCTFSANSVAAVRAPPPDLARSAHNSFSPSFSHTQVLTRNRKIANSLTETFHPLWNSLTDFAIIHNSQSSCERKVTVVPSGEEKRSCREAFDGLRHRRPPPPPRRCHLLRPSFLCRCRDLTSRSPTSSAP